MVGMNARCFDEWLRQPVTRGNRASWVHLPRKVNHICLSVTTWICFRHRHVVKAMCIIRLRKHHWFCAKPSRRTWRHPKPWSWRKRIITTNVANKGYTRSYWMNAHKYKPAHSCSSQRVEETWMRTQWFAIKIIGIGVRLNIKHAICSLHTDERSLQEFPKWYARCFNLLWVHFDLLMVVEDALCSSGI